MKRFVVLILVALALCDTLSPQESASSCEAFIQTKTCPNETKPTPVCGYSGIFDSRTNFSSPCLACINKDISINYYTVGACSAPQPPPFVDCQSHSDLISKCALLDYNVDFSVCLVDAEGRTSQSNYTSYCEDYCSNASIVRYIDASCDDVHQGKSISAWAKQTKAKVPPKIPTKNLEDGYTRCKQPRNQVCGKNKNPVCGVLTVYDQNEYDNECLACLDANVMGWRKGKCSAINPPQYILCLQQTDEQKKFFGNSSENCSVCTVAYDNSQIQNGDCVQNPCVYNYVRLYVKKTCEEIISEIPVRLWSLAFGVEHYFQTIANSQQESSKVPTEEVSQTPAKAAQNPK